MLSIPYEVEILKIKKIAKFILSAAISFVLLNAVCFLYYNVPVHSESATNSTDYVWEKSKFYSRGTEGFAWGKTDAKGFNNLSAENSEKPDILVMGTSHTEAFNVSQAENYAYLLGELFDSDTNNMSVYNIGISGHSITTCLNNFESAVNEFNPGKYVVMEVTKAELSQEEINLISEGNVKKIHSSANPILILLQKMPFVRCVYYQIDKMGLEFKLPTLKKTQTPTTHESVAVDEADKDAEYETSLNLLMEKIGNIAKENNIRLILVINTTLQIDDDGSVIPSEKSEKEKLFETACNNNGIFLTDMYIPYADYYNENHRLPHGFSNTAVGVGHLNKYGHLVVANELYELIAETENKNSFAS